MKAIKLGQYRMAIMVIIAILTGIVVLTEAVTIYLALGLVGLGWVILEISIVLRTVLALQRMVAYAIDPKRQAGEIVRGVEEN